MAIEIMFCDEVDNVFGIAHRVAIFLASRAGAFVVGETIALDGGILVGGHRGAPATTNGANDIRTPI